MIFMHIPFHSVRFHSIANWIWCYTIHKSNNNRPRKSAANEAFSTKNSLIMVSIMFVLFVRYFVRMLYFNSIFCLMSSLSLKSRFLFWNHRESLDSLKSWLNCSNKTWLWARVCMLLIVCVGITAHLVG